MKNLICIIAIFFTFAVNYNDAYQADDIYNSLPEDDKIHFIRYYLVKGLVDTETRDAVAYRRINFRNNLKIPDNVVRTFENTQLEPPNFHHKLIEKFVRKYHLSRAVAFKALTGSCPPNYCGRPTERYICVPENQCIDLGDVGGICCT